MELVDTITWTAMEGTTLTVDSDFEGLYWFKAINAVETEYELETSETVYKNLHIHHSACDAVITNRRISHLLLPPRGTGFYLEGMHRRSMHQTSSWLLSR